jgi:hypothetical protein
MNRDKDHPTLSWRLLFCVVSRVASKLYTPAVLPPVILGLFVHGPALRSMEANGSYGSGADL